MMSWGDAPQFVPLIDLSMLSLLLARVCIVLMWWLKFNEASRVTPRNFGCLSGWMRWLLRKSWSCCCLALPERLSRRQVVFNWLALSLHFWSHLVNATIDLLRWRLMAFMLLWQYQRLRSSAKTAGVELLLLLLGMSLKKMMKSSGPKTLPWGTPALIVLVVEKIESILTLNVLSFR